MRVDLLRLKCTRRQRLRLGHEEDISPALELQAVLVGDLTDALEKHPLESSRVVYPQLLASGRLQVGITRHLISPEVKRLQRADVLRGIIRSQLH